MLVFSVSRGIRLICCGFSFIFTPLASLMSIGYFIIILFFISGIYNIVKGIKSKNYGFDFIFGVLSIILGIVMLFIPDATPAEVTEGVAALNTSFILYVAAAWFFIKGILTIVGSVKAKKLGAGTGTVACGVILGILEIGLTVYSILHPMVLAFAVAWLLGFYFIETGINMIALANQVDRAKTVAAGAAVGATVNAAAAGAAFGAAANEAAHEAADAASSETTDSAE